MRHPALAASLGQVEAPERLWTRFVPAPVGGAFAEAPVHPDRWPGTAGSYAAGPARSAKTAGRTARGSGGAYGRRRGPAVPRQDVWQGPPAQGTPSGRWSPPVTAPEETSEPRPLPTPPARPPSADRSPSADRPRPAPNPCATFGDFRRDYCDQVLGRRR
ncbi:hypothetical protein [Sphaerisporangium flaviroseum]|uniref:hypothetical protein n=1 Tax=Sphaerisporangium flaviroseum TaxID=509199 RepID=UPI0031EF6AFA